MQRQILLDPCHPALDAGPGNGSLTIKVESKLLQLQMSLTTQEVSLSR